MNSTANNEQNTELKNRLLSLRQFLSQKNYQAILIRATDEYLNEYIPLSQNERTYFTGFTGSTGDLLVTTKEAFLFVDGRYHIQARLETPTWIEVVQVPSGISNKKALEEKLILLSRSHPSKNQGTWRVVVDGRKISLQDYSFFQDTLKKYGAQLVLLKENVKKNGFSKEESKRKESKKAPQEELKELPTELISLSHTGLSTEEKKISIQDWLKEKNCDFLLVSALDELSYLLNLRNYSLPYNATCKGLALVGKTQSFLFLGSNGKSLADGSLRRELQKSFEFYSERDFDSVLGKKLSSLRSFSIAFDESTAPYQRIKTLKEQFQNRLTCSHYQSPLAMMKAIKTLEELNSMSESFLRADRVVKESIEWANQEVIHGKSISEKDFADRVEELFFSHGAKALSFPVISACGENSAIIHYTQASSKRFLKIGEIMLVDTGAYFDGGYATDLTRSFLVGAEHAKSTEEQRKIYTLVLKSAIRVMKTRFPKGTPSSHLDSIARSTLWEYGHGFNHGTGHGVGIGVHESPPNLGIRCQDELKANMVFSVEPGIYIEGFMGVRIENLVTLKLKKETHKETHLEEPWLQVQPMTFCPLDKHLIDKKYLDAQEILWLDNYQKQGEKLLEKQKIRTK